MSTEVKHDIFHEINQLLIRVLSHDSGDNLRSSLGKAKEEFFRKKGKTIGEDPFFESRMSLFEEWFLLTRPFHEGLTPLQIFIENNKKKLSQQELKSYIQLSCSHNSIFELLHSWTQPYFYVRDVLYGGDWLLCHFPPFAAIEPGQYFEGRLVNFTGDNRLFPGIIVYPTTIKDELEAMLAHLRKKNFSNAQIINLFSKLLVKGYRYSHLNLKRFFNPEDPMVKSEFKNF